MLAECITMSTLKFVFLKTHRECQAEEATAIGEWGALSRKAQVA